MKRCARCCAFYDDTHTCAAAQGPSTTPTAPAANAPALVGVREIPDTQMVANVVANRHGKYRDVEKRRVYMREHMRKLRAELKRQRAQ